VKQIPKTASCKQHCRSLHILQLLSLYIYKILVDVKFNLSDFKTNSVLHSHNTRRKDDVHTVPCYRSRYKNNFTNVRFEVFTPVTMKNGVFWVVTLLQEPHGETTQKTPFFNFTNVGFRLLNYLPQRIKSINVLCKFKNALKTYLLSHCFYSIAEFLSPGTNTTSNQLYHIIH
jgi:hypothetical protein